MPYPFEIITISCIIVSAGLIYFIYHLSRLTTYKPYNIYFILLVLIFNYSFHIIIHHDLWHTAFWLYPFYLTGFFSVYPLFYLHIKQLVFSKKELSNRNQKKVFILPLLILMISVPYYFVIDAEYRIEYIKNLFYSDPVTTFEIIYFSTTSSLYFIQMIVFLFLFNKLRKAAKQNMVDRMVIKNITVKFIKILMILIISFETSLAVFISVFPVPLHGILINSLSLIFLIYIGLLIINQTTMLIQNRLKK